MLDYDGSDKKELLIVPARGGRFTGRITVPSVKDDIIRNDGQTVLNYTDIITKVVDKLINTSTMAIWDSTTSELTFTDNSGSINGLCVVLGLDSELGLFATTNQINKTTYPNKWLPNFLYIGTDTGNIYLGKTESDGSTSTRQLATAADTIKSSDGTYDYTAETIKTNFDTLSNTIDNVNTKLTGIVNGIGNQHVQSSELSYEAEVLTDGPDILVNLASNTSDTVNSESHLKRRVASFPGVTGILTPANGGTGTNDLRNVSVGSATSITVHTSTGSGAAPQATYTTRKIILSTKAPGAADGNNGDIWIKYS